MPVEIRVPEMGESIVEATIARWIKHPGEHVSAGEPVAELETEKVNLEIGAPEEGVLAQISQPEGATVTVGQVIGAVEEGRGQAPPAAPPPVARDQAEPPPAVAAPPSPPATSPGKTRAAPQAGEQARAEPQARHLAERVGVPIEEIPGTGVGGRVTRQDVENYLARTQKAGPAAPAAPSAPAPARPERPAPPAEPAPVQAEAPRTDSARLVGPSDRYSEPVRLSRRRQTIARRLSEAHLTAVMTTTYNEVDMTAIMDIRARRRDAFRERHGVGLGFMSFFTKAVIGALKAYPELNAEIDGDEMVYHYFYDIGIAVSSDEGLVVPVVRDADKKTFAEIESTIADLARRTRERKLTLEDLQGGTFSITNGGVFGSLLSTPLLNPPQVGILGMHNIVERPVAINGQVQVRPMMYVALTYDHRVVDGSTAVQFLVHLKQLLEDPMRMLIDV